MSPEPQRWALGLYAGPSPFALVPVAGANPILTRWGLGETKADFVADPFLLQHDGEWLVAFEVMNAASGRGEIGLASSIDGRTFSYRGIVLAEPFHLSYPALFVEAGEVFLVPETLGAGAVRLYRAPRFPGAFEPVADLVPGRLADPTPFFHAGRWWLFACPTPETHDSLELYSANALTGPWSAHPQNPLIAGDPRQARPGGGVVAWHGGLWRLAQDCGPAYGSRVVAFEILELSRERYRERAVGPILEPTGSGWNGARMHHLDAHRLTDGSWLAVVDGYARDDEGSQKRSAER